MLYFRDHHWVRVNSTSRFNAHLLAGSRSRKDVFLCLDMKFIAGEAKWRRVKEWERPTFSLSLSSIRPPARSWEDLETYNFWSDPKTDKFGDDFDWYYHGAGFLEVWYHGKGSGEPEYTFGGDCVWRVVERDGRWFTIEMAGLADGVNLRTLQQELPITVTSTGEEERAEPDEAFWKQNSVFYMMERVPFGTVTVTVPRNVADPEAYATAKGRSLVGFGEPEHITISDHAKSGNGSEAIKNELYVELQFNGYYED